MSEEYPLVEIPLATLCDELDRRLKHDYRQGKLPKRLLQTFARIANKQRENPGGGRPQVLRACEVCGAKFSAREMREHKRQHKK
jgi:hypothetical protein